jgi:hypothetical protein
MPEARGRRRFVASPGVSLLSLFTMLFLAGPARAQDRAASNEFGFWFEGQSGNAHAFGSTINSRMYQFEGRYTRLVYMNRLLALRHLAEVIPLSLVGEPQANGQRVYAYGAGGSPTGIQLNFLLHRESIQFSQAGEASSISTGRCSAPLSSILPPNLGRECKRSPRGTAASSWVINIITFPMRTWAFITRAWTRTWCL